MEAQCTLLSLLLRAVHKTAFDFYVTDKLLWPVSLSMFKPISKNIQQGIQHLAIDINYKLNSKCRNVLMVY